MGFHRRTINKQLLQFIYHRDGITGIEKILTGKHDIISFNDNESLEIYHVFRSYFDSDITRWQIICNLLNYNIYFKEGKSTT